MVNQSSSDKEIASAVKTLFRSFAKELVKELESVGTVLPVPTPESQESLSVRRDFPELVAVTHWSKYFDSPSVHGLRYMIYQGELTGFEKCVRRMGRRVYIHTPSFFEWVESENRVK